MCGLLRTAEKGPASCPAGWPRNRGTAPAAPCPRCRPAPARRAAGRIPVTAYIARQPREVAARGKWRPGASGSAALRERVPCPVWRLRWVAAGPGAGAREAAAAVSRVPQTEALLSPQVRPWRTPRRTGPCRAGPAAGPW